MAEGGSPARGQQRRTWHQFAAVGRKNALLVRKHWKGSTASQLVAPVLVVLILKMMQAIGNSALSKPDPSPQVRVIEPLGSCRGSGVHSGRHASACDTLLYAPRGVAWVEEVMAILREQNGLGEGEVRPAPGIAALHGGSAQEWCVGDASTPLPCEMQTFDVAGGGEGGEGGGGATTLAIPNPACASGVLAQGRLFAPCAKMRDNATLVAHMLAHPGATQNVVVFPAGYLGLSAEAAAAIPFGYDLYYNSSTERFPFRGNDHSLEAKRALDQAILSFTAARERDVNGGGGGALNASSSASLWGRPAAALNATWSAFPRPEPRLKGFSAVAVGGGYWFYLPPMIVFFTTLIDIVREKESGSRLMMSVMGLPNAVNWAVWFLQGSLFAQASSIILIAAGLACGFDIFWNANVLVLFLLFSLFATAMVSASQLLATLVSTVKSAQTIGYAIILIGFVFQAILGSGYGSLIYLLQSESLPSWVVPIRSVDSAHHLSLSLSLPLSPVPETRKNAKEAAK